jgi:hypothetical protein
LAQSGFASYRYITAFDSLVKADLNPYIQALIRAIGAEQNKISQEKYEVSLDELVKQARSHASSKVLNSFSKVRLLNKRQIAVDRLYVDVYLLEMREFHATIPGLLEGQDVRGQFDRLGLGQRGERSQGLELAASPSYPRLMVLGKPGSGKSTFLRHLAVGCARGEFLGDYIPVLLELRDVEAADFSLFQCIHRELGLQQESQTEQVLRQGRVLMLLDGLDEVPHSLRQRVQTELRRFVKRYDKNRFILTCRTQTIEYIPEQFEVLEVADFTPEQLEGFALNWFTAMAENPEQGAAVKDHFMEKLRENPQTAELAVTPVLLSLICWIFDGLQCLPEKRSDLYEKGLDLLLQQWDKGRGIHRNSGSDRYAQLTVEERKQLLSYLAVRKFKQAENFVLFEEAEICGYIAEHLQISAEESREVLGAIAQEHGLLIERAHGIWSFSHLTFQEYFVAKYFISVSIFDDLLQSITTQSWREIFLLVCEILENSDELLLAMKVKADELSVEDKNSYRKIQDLLKWMQHKASSINLPYKTVAIRAFYLEILSQKMSNQPILYRTGLANLLGLSGAETSGYKDQPRGQLMLEYILSSSLQMLQIANSSLFLPSNALSEYLYIYKEDDEAFSVNSELTQKLKMLQIDLENLRSMLKNYEPRQELTNAEFVREKLNILVVELRGLMMQYCGLGYNWEFNEEQNICLQRYHYVNFLLIECLIIADSTTSVGVKQEIELTLLLPIAEIEKRRNQRSD